MILRPGRSVRPVCSLESRGQLLVALAPDGGPGLGLELGPAGGGVLVGEGEVAVRPAGAGQGEVRNFGHHPVGVGEPLTQRLAHPGQQLAQGQGGGRQSGPGGRGGRRKPRFGAAVVERHQDRKLRSSGRGAARTARRECRAGSGCGQPATALRPRWLLEVNHFPIIIGRFTHSTCLLKPFPVL